MNGNQNKGCIFGVGSTQGNDAAGWQVVKSLGAALPSSFVTMSLTEPTELLASLDRFDRVWIVDACRSEHKVGTITRFVWPDDRIDGRWSLSGHGVGLAKVLELAGTLGSLPRETVVYTIDVGRNPIMPGEKLADEVADAVLILRDQLLYEIGAIHFHSANGFTQKPSNPHA